MARLNEVPFVKGHGTGNDFVVIPDIEGRLDLTAEQVRWVCDRHRGIGADGVLRVVRTDRVPEFVDFAPVAEFFMDYRNADGSLAEMCGNGARVFVRYLDATGLVTDNDVVIATRGGLRSTTINSDRTITIDMGQATTPRARAMPHVTVEDRTWPATGVLVPNPHAVVFVDDLHERGVGETQSCGTGACAVAWAARRRQGDPAPGESTWQIDVPGGTVHVTETAAGAMLLTGPADLVARGTILLPG
ncbi:MAG: diaminopimelate epimerase [Actinobacteria bacterium]|nr:diaminopimelate epimerase [Actinomycetota bacterium]